MTGNRKGDFEVVIKGSPQNPKIVEIDANIIARLIMRDAYARPKAAAKAANAIVDYLGDAMSGIAALH